MRTFVRNTLIELTKKPAKVEAADPYSMGTRVPAPAPPPKPQPKGNRRQRRHQQAMMVAVQKQLRKRGINMEMGPVGQRDVKSDKIIKGISETGFYTDQARKMVGIDYGSGPDRHETIIEQVSENGQILALVPDDQVEEYLREHPGSRRQSEPALEPTDAEGIFHELALRGDAYVKKPDGS
jgi:hypothetical protein